MSTGCSSSGGACRNDPILVAVTGKEDVVANVFVVEVLQGSIAIGNIALATCQQNSNMDEAMNGPCIHSSYLR